LLPVTGPFPQISHFFAMIFSLYPTSAHEGEAIPEAVDYFAVLQLFSRI
jgi:hypothetical protein